MHSCTPSFIAFESCSLQHVLSTPIAIKSLNAQLCTFVFACESYCLQHVVNTLLAITSPNGQLYTFVFASESCSRQHVVSTPIAIASLNAQLFAFVYCLRVLLSTACSEYTVSLNAQRYTFLCSVLCLTLPAVGSCRRRN